MKKIELKDFLNFNYLSNLKTNESKKVTSFVRSVANYEKDCYVSSLYLKQNEKVSRVHTFESGNQYYWLSEKDILLNTSSKDQQKDKLSSFSIYNIESGEIDHHITFKLPISSIDIIDNNTYLITSNLSKDDFSLLDDELRSDYLSLVNKNKNFETFESIPFYMNGAGFTQEKSPHLFIYNLSTDTYKHITPLTVDSRLCKVDKINKTLYFTQSEKTGVPVMFNTLHKYNILTDEYITLISEPNYSISRVILLNNDVYVMANDLEDYGINQNGDFYKVVDNSLTLVSKFGLSSGNSIGSDVRLGSNPLSDTIDNKYYFTGTFHDRTRIYVFDGDSVQVIFEPKGSIDGWVKTDSGFTGIGLFENRLQEVYDLDVNTMTMNQVTKFNIKLLEGKYVAQPHHITYENDGVQLDGWVLLPEGYDSSLSYPAILYIHGGPKTIYSDVYYHEMQVWANLGYIVFFTNPRGGDVYDDKFADIRGKYGTIDYQDIMKFTDIVLDIYSIDPARVGVTGGSYGGFMTNWIVSHTDRFKAAATQRSISNWISFYGTSDIGIYFGKDQTDSNPYDSIEKMWEQSPLKHALNIKTPLLFIHSDEDYRCPIEQAMQLFSVVKQNGVDTRFVWFKGENHDLSRSGRPQSRVKRLEEITEWFNTKL